MGWLKRLLKRRKRRRRRRRRGWQPPQMRRRLRTLTLLARVKNDRKYRPSKKNRIRLRRWFGGKGWRRRVRRLTTRQLRRAVDLNGNFSIRRLSRSARDAMGLTDYQYNALQGKGQLRSRSFNNSGFRKVQKQKREMRVATRNLQNKKLFGANRLKLLQNLAYKNSYNEEIRDKYPGLADSKPGRFGGKSVKTLMASARGGRGIRGRRVKKLVGEHGQWTSGRTNGGQFVTIDGKSYRGTYHTFSDGISYTGWNPGNSIRWTQVLIPKEQYDENQEIYQQIYGESKHIDRRTGRTTNMPKNDD